MNSKNLIPITLYARKLGGFLMNGTVTFTHDPLQFFLGSIPVVKDYGSTNSTLTWNFENLVPGASISFRIFLNLPPGVDLGTPIKYTATIGPEENDINLHNNNKMDIIS